jgi:hypothetical protein
MAKATEKFAELREELEALRQKTKKRAGLLFAEAASEIFGEYPNLDAFSWQQYTTYFNDGDECHFYVREYTLKMKINGNWTMDENDEYEEEDETKHAPVEMRKSLEQLINAIDGDVMKQMYGDHVEVTINRDGSAETEEYVDHD